MLDTLSAIKVKGYFSYMDWSPFEIDATVPLVEKSACLIDGTAMKTICTLIGNDGTRRIRIGCCPSCGYIGYINRIHKDWFIEYYAKRWDAQGEEASDIQAEIERRKQSPAPLDIKKAEYAVELVRRIAPDKKRPLCEIGSGFGYTLKTLHALGFSNVIGIEPSKHRASIIQGAYGLPVIQGSFGEKYVTEQLASHAPIGLIYSFHVLEHVYDPNEVIALAATLQNEGGYIIITVPNFFGEPTHIALFQLIHQHIFTPEALKLLFEKNGYEVFDDGAINEKGQQISLIGQKRIGQMKKERYHEKIDYVGRAIEKYAHGLELLIRSESQYSLKDRTYRKVMRQKTVYKSVFWGGIHWWFQTNILKRKKWPMAIVADKVSKRYTSPEESPLEVQFEENILMLYQ